MSSQPVARWFMRRGTEELGPMTEPELRKQLAIGDLSDCVVRDQTSGWHPAAAVKAKFDRLQNQGVYRQHGGKIEGPFTLQRGLELAEAHSADEFRVGLHGVWTTAARFISGVRRQQAVPRPTEVPTSGGDGVSSKPARASSSTDRGQVSGDPPSQNAAAPVSSSPNPPARASAAAAGQTGASAATGQASAAAARTGTVDVVCPGCQSQLRLPAGSIGGKARCPQCSIVFRVPDNAVATPAHGPVSTPTGTSSPVSGGFGQPTPGGFGRPNPGGFATSATGGFGNAPAGGGAFAASGGGMGGLPSGASFGTHPGASGMGNPYAPTSAPAAPHPTVAATGDRSIHYIVPGACLILLGVLSCLSVLGNVLGAIFGAISPQPGMGDDAVWVGVGVSAFQAVVAAVFAAIYIAGAMAMFQRKRSQLGIARAASIFMAVPCFSCFLFPAGIWGCVSTFSQHAQRDFCN